MFGQYAFAAPNGVMIRVGDEVRVTERAAEADRVHKASDKARAETLVTAADADRGGPSTTDAAHATEESSQDVKMG